MKRCNQCWQQKPSKAFRSPSSHNCIECTTRMTGAYQPLGRHPALDRKKRLHVLWVRKSDVRKLGPIPSSSTAGYTCPTTCSLRGNGCYAEFGLTGSWWRALSDGRIGIGWKAFCKEVRQLPLWQLWRHNLAGDLPGDSDCIDLKALAELVLANAIAQARGFTFTHKPWTSRDNLSAIRGANRLGFTINVSADSVEHADAAFSLGLPTTVMVREHASGRFLTPLGRRVLVCPAQRSEHASCASCRWCARADRNWIVGFRAHGQMKKRLSLRMV
jgi:hypothetical protein